MFKPILTIGMPTYDDYHGVYFSINAIRLYHQELKNIELIVVDNRPGSKHGEATAKLMKTIKGKYIPFTKWTSTSVGKNMVFENASADYVVCIDSHVMITPGALQKLVEFYAQNSLCRDLLQGPMLNTSMSLTSHMRDSWSDHMWGVWGMDERARDLDAEPFEIQMHGTGLIACRKDGWLGFNDLFRGFGGQAGYIHEKYRQAGRKTLCLPFLRWMHRFDRPDGTMYSVDKRDKFRNYVVGFKELNLDMAPLIDHFRSDLGDHKIMAIISEVESHFKKSARATCILYARCCSESALNETVESFFRQDYDDKELIIINDCPNREIISDLNGVKIINDGSTLIERLDIAVAQSSGQYIMIWSDNNIYLPNYISNAIERLGDSQVWNHGGAWEHRDDRWYFVKWNTIGGLIFTKEFSRNNRFNKMMLTQDQEFVIDIDQWVEDCGAKMNSGVSLNQCLRINNLTDVPSAKSQIVLLPYWAKDYEAIIDAAATAQQTS